MSLKIMGGMAKGQPLGLPKGNATRPTSALLKRRIFDSFQDLSGHHFIDLCAGSGSVGLEAWSRGAESVVFIENNKVTLKALKENITTIKRKFPEESHKRPLILSQVDAKKFVASLSLSGSTILFFDPPYLDHSLYKELALPLISEASVDFIWIESDRQKGLPLTFWEEAGCTPKKVYWQGTSYLAVF